MSEIVATSARGVAANGRRATINVNRARHELVKTVRSERTITPIEGEWRLVFGERVFIPNM